jgi:hypothetical protein
MRQATGIILCAVTVLLASSAGPAPALPDFAAHPSPSTVRVTTLIDPGGDSSIEPGPKDITGTVGADDDTSTALGGYIWDTVLRAGKTVRHYGIYDDEDYYAGPLLVLLCQS